MKFAILQLWQRKSLGSPEEEAGCSLHLTCEDHRKFTEKYWEARSKNIPQHYNVEFGKAVMVEVTDALYRRIEKGRSEAGIKLAYLPRELQELVPIEFTNPNKWGENHISVV